MPRRNGIWIRAFLPLMVFLSTPWGTATAQEKTHLDIGAIHEAHLHANALRLFGVRDPLRLSLIHI